MATYIKTLKEDNGDIVYPQTTTDAIYTTGGETLETRISKYVTAEDIAQSVASFGTVTTGMIADDAITTAKIDDDAVTTAKIDDSAVTTAKVADAAITSQKIDWTTIVEDDLTLSIAGGVTRMKVVVFGKIAFINLAFTPSATGNGTICSTGNYKPRFNTELTLFTGSNGTVSRRALWNTNGTVSGDYWTADFTRVFGVAFLA